MADIDLSGIDQWETDAGVSLKGIDDWEKDAGVEDKPAPKDDKSVASDVGHWLGAGSNLLAAGAGWALKGLTAPDRGEPDKGVAAKFAKEHSTLAQQEQIRRQLDKEYWLAPGNVAREAAHAVGVDQVGQAVMEQGLSGAEHFREGLSERAKAAGQKKFLTTGDDAAWKDPYAVAGTVIESLPGMIIPMGPAGLAAKTAASRAAAVAAKEAIARGATREVVEAEARAAATTAAQQAAVTTSVAGEGAVVGAQGGQQTFQAVMDMPEEKLQQSPQYQELVGGGMAPAAAREQLALSASKDAAVASAVIGALAGKIGAKVTSKVLTEPAQEGLTRGMAKAAAREGVEESLQSGGEQVGQNLGVQQNVDANQSLTEGVGEQMAGGLVAGSAMGAGLGGMHRADAHMDNQQVPQREAAAAVPALPSEQELQAQVAHHEGRAAELQSMAEEARAGGSEQLATRYESEAAASLQASADAKTTIEREYRGLTGVVNRNADVVAEAGINQAISAGLTVPALPAPDETLIAVDSQGQARTETPTNLRNAREQARELEREQLAARGDTAVPSDVVPQVDSPAALAPTPEPVVPGPAALPAPDETVMVAGRDGVMRPETPANLANQRATDRAARAEVLAEQGDTVVPSAKPGAALVVRSGGDAWAATKQGLEQAQRARKARNMERTHQVVRTDDGYALAHNDAVVPAAAPVPAPTAPVAAPATRAEAVEQEPAAPAPAATAQPTSAAAAPVPSFREERARALAAREVTGTNIPYREGKGGMAASAKEGAVPANTEQRQPPARTQPTTASAAWQEKLAADIRNDESTSPTYRSLPADVRRKINEERLAARLKDEAFPADATTGLINGKAVVDPAKTEKGTIKGLFLESMFNAAITHVRHGGKARVRELDLGNLGGINHYSGQAGGDKALADVGGILSQALQGVDVELARHGGDEFFTTSRENDPATEEAALHKANDALQEYMGKTTPRMLNPGLEASIRGDADLSQQEKDDQLRYLDTPLAKLPKKPIKSADGTLQYVPGKTKLHIGKAVEVEAKSNAAALHTDADARLAGAKNANYQEQKNENDELAGVRESSAQRAEEHGLGKARAGGGASDADGPAPQLHGRGLPGGSPVAAEVARPVSRGSRRPVNPETDDLLAAISKLGGLNRDAASAEGIDPDEFKRTGYGILRVFTKGGVAFDAMAERLHELGYPIQDGGNYSANELLNQVDAALRGKRVMAPVGHQRDALLEQARQAMEEGDAEALEAVAPPSPDTGDGKGVENDGEFLPQTRVNTELYVELLGRGWPPATLNAAIESLTDATQTHDALAALLNQEVPDEGGSEASGAVRSSESAGQVQERPRGLQAAAEGHSGVDGEDHLPGWQSVDQEAVPVDYGDLTDAEIERVVFDGLSIEQVRAERAPDFSLSPQTEDDIRAKEAREQDTAAAAQADERAGADAAADVFTLSTGTGTAGQQVKPAVAGGQAGLFDATVRTRGDGKAVAKAKDAQRPAGARIEDFGEKIGGARKDVWGGFRDSLESELPADYKDITLAKHFPEPNYEKLLEAGAPEATLATIKALRDQMPAKPRQSWKLRAWVDNLRVLRDLSAQLLEGKITVAKLRSELNGGGRTLSQFVDKLDIYVGVGYPTFLKADDAELRWGTHFTYEGDTRHDHPNQYGIFVNGRRVGETFFKEKADAIAALKQHLDGQEAAKKAPRKTTLDLYRVTATGKVMIGKKIGTNRYLDLRAFDSAKEARAYLHEHETELLAELEKIRAEQNNVPTRRSTNDPRRGEDFRLGEDITPEQFGNAFGFRGVEFGNWVEQGRRQQDLNNAFDALMDMAKTLGIHPKAVSLNGSLGLAFGARGKSRAAAHYEPGKVVINLTKMEGAGALGHEWWHAMDNYFSRMRSMPDKFVSAQPHELVQKGIRPEVLEAYGRLMQFIKEAPFTKRSKQLDRKRPDDYWSQPEELSARAFEAYLIDKAKERGEANDYLANLIDPRTAEVVFSSGTSDWPYPFDEEMQPLTKAFDKLFATIKTKETDQGVAMYSRNNSWYAKPVRAPWNDFPPVESLHPLKTLEKADADLYQRGKAGDIEAAMTLVDKVLTEADVERLRAKIGDSQPVLVPVLAEEQTGRNRLPHAFAAVLADRLGLPMEDRIVQTVRAGHTNAGAYTRIARQPQFAGPVEKGQTYLILDDTVTMGGTLAALRGHIESQGGKVVLASTLTGFKDRNTITPSPGMLAGIRAKHPDLPKWWNDEYGFPLEHLTQGELGHLRAAPSLDAIRDRLAEGRRGENVGQDEGVAGRPQKGQVGLFPSSAELSAHLRAGTLAEPFGRLLEAQQIVLHDSPPAGVAADAQAWTDNDGRVHLVASQLTPDTAEPVLLHEAFHSGAQPLIGSHAWNALQDRLKALYQQFQSSSPEGKANQFYQRAMRRVEAAGTPDADRVEEFGAYAIEEYAGAPRTIQSWVDDVVGSVKAWTLRRFGRQIGAVTPAQLRALSVAALRSGRTGKPGGGGGNKFSRRGDQPGAEPLYGRWQLPEPSRLVTNLIDRFHRVGQVQKAVQSQGGTLTDSTNVHAAEQRYHSRASGRLERFREHTVEPLFKAMAKAGVNPEDVGLYLYAKHAPERNAQIAKLHDKPNGKEFQDGGSGMTNAEAKAILADFDKRGLTPELQRFAQQFWDMTRRTRNVLVNSGLESADAVSAWEGTYQHYVPLAGRDEANNARLAITGQGFSVRGGQKRAMGRRSKAKHILEQVIAQHEAAVIRAEKNDVAKHLLRFVQANPDSDLWEINPKEERRYINAAGVVESRLQPLTTDQNVVAVRVGGQDQFILVHDDATAKAIKQLDNRQLGVFLQGMARVARFLSAVFTSFSPPFMAVNFIRDLGTALIHGTQVKDSKFAFAIMRKIGPAMRELIRDTRTGQSDLVQLYEQAGGRTGMVSMIKEVEEKHRELQSILYQTRGVPLQEVLDAFKESRKEGFKALGSKARYNFGTRWIKAFFELVEAVNGVIENTTRLAAFMAAQERGLPVNEAGSIAKNLTVNFNRKGEWAPAIGSLYVFFNASVQGSARMFEALKDKRVWGMAAGIVASSFAVAMMNYGAGDDDDDGREDWEQVSDWDKSRNLVFLTGDGEYVKIPLPLGYNIFHMLGTELARAARSKRPDPGLKAAASMTSAIWTAFNPVGEGIPSVLAPFWEIAKNEDAFGSPIRPDYKSDLPDSQQFFGSMEGGVLQRSTQALNEAAGGNAFRSSGPVTDWNPENMAHVMKFFGGGAGRFVMDLVDAGDNLLHIGPDAVEARQLPFARQVTGQITGDSQTGQFYENKETVEALAREIKGLRKEGTPAAAAEAARVQREHPMALALAKRAENVSKADKEDRLQEQALRNNMELSPREKFLEQKRLREKRAARMKGFNRTFNAATQEK